MSINSLFSILEVLADIRWEKLRQFGELLFSWRKAQGSYEVLDYQVELELCDATGQYAIYRKHQEIKFLQDNVMAYSDKVWGDGEIFAKYKCSLGVAVDRYKDGYRWRVLISLREVKHKNEQDVIQIERHIGSGFTHEIEELQTDIDQQRQQNITLEQAHALFEKVAESWDTMSHEEHRRVLSLFIERIEASDYDRAGAMSLQIFWRDNSSSKLEIGRKPRADNFSYDDIQQLLQLFDAGASQVEIAREFPKLKWYQIFNEIKRHRGKIRFPISYFQKNETYEDYVAIGGRKDKATCSPWRPEEIELLKEMVENGATRLELMEQFPVRRYRQLREKIKQVCGELPSIPNPDEVSQDLMYYEYAQETKSENDECGSGNAVQNFLWRLARALDFLARQNPVSQRW